MHKGAVVAGTIRAASGRRRGATTVVALVLTVAAAACGGSSSSGLAALCKGYSDLLVTAAVRKADATRTQLVLLHNDGRPAAVLTGDDVVATHPSFSPDGQRVVFEEQAGAFAGAGPTASALAVIGVDGKGLQRITGGASWSDDPADHHGGPYDLRPGWSPGGDTILFSHREGATQELYTVRPGSRPTRLLAAPEGARDIVAAWSPDGRRIAFVRDVGTAKHPAQQLWTAGADGRGAVMQAQFADAGNTSLLNLTWSPDGQRVALAHPGPARVAQPLRVLDVGTAGISSSTVSSDLAWSRDGQRLYAWSSSARGWQLTLLRLSGGAIADVHGLGPAGPYVGAAGLDATSCR
jgi:Tol biopolymer transport system component